MNRKTSVTVHNKDTNETNQESFLKICQY